VKEILEAAGCVVSTAHDGAAGLRCVESTPLDLVLSDVVMPEMDGYELYMAIRKTHPELPVLMMTGFHYDREHVIKRSRLEGLEGVIFKKPVDPNRLIEVILETVAKRRGR
jgi:CheY-like chemotaxis protein